MGILYISWKTQFPHLLIRTTNCTFVTSCAGSYISYSCKMLTHCEHWIHADDDDDDDDPIKLKYPKVSFIIHLKKIVWKPLIFLHAGEGNINYKFSPLCSSHNSMCENQLPNYPTGDELWCFWVRTAADPYFVVWLWLEQSVFCLSVLVSLLAEHSR